MANRKIFYLGRLQVANYDLTVISESEEDALNALRRHYARWKRGYHLDDTFDEYFEYAGGSVIVMKLNQEEDL